jgi:hypothetical protein
MKARRSFKPPDSLRLNDRFTGDADNRRRCTLVFKAPPIAIKTQIGDGSRGAGMKRTKQGKSDEARPMLTNVYRWFIEGFDTPDLKDGKAFEGFGVDLVANQRAPSSG